MPFSSTPIPISLTTSQPAQIFSNSGSPPQDWNSRSLGSSPNDHQSTLYKTELCRSFTETGYCRYGLRCQFAHGEPELRPVARHPKYKTAICKTFHTIGTCPYGTRCRFIHTLDQSPTENNQQVCTSVKKPNSNKPKKAKRNSEGLSGPPSPTLSIRSPFSQSAPTLPTVGAPRMIPNGFMDPSMLQQHPHSQSMLAMTIHHLPPISDQLSKIPHNSALSPLTSPRSIHSTLTYIASHPPPMMPSPSIPLPGPPPNQIPQPSHPVSIHRTSHIPPSPHVPNGYPQEGLTWSDEEKKYRPMSSLKPVLLSLGGVGLGGVVSMASAAAVVSS